MGECPTTGGGDGVGSIVGVCGDTRSVGSGKVSGGGGCTGVEMTGTGLVSSTCDGMSGSAVISDVGIV